MASNRRFSLRFLLVFVALVCIGVYAYFNRIKIAYSIFSRDQCVARTLSNHTKSADIVEIRINNNSDQAHELVYRDEFTTWLRLTIDPKEDATLKIVLDTSGSLMFSWNDEEKIQKILPPGTHLSYGYNRTPRILGTEKPLSYFNGRPFLAGTLVYEFWIDLQ